MEKVRQHGNNVHEYVLMIGHIHDFILKKSQLRVQKVSSNENSPGISVNIAMWETTHSPHLLAAIGDTGRLDDLAMARRRFKDGARYVCKALTKRVGVGVWIPVGRCVSQ